MTFNPAENTEEEFRQRAAILAEALQRLPPDAVTLSALFEVAVSAAIAVTLDPSTARVFFEARCQEYERLGVVASRRRIGH